MSFKGKWGLIDARNGSIIYSFYDFACGPCCRFCAFGRAYLLDGHLATPEDLQELDALASTEGYYNDMQFYRCCLPFSFYTLRIRDLT